MRENFRWHINDEMMWLLKGDMYIEKFMFGDSRKNVEATYSALYD